MTYGRHEMLCHTHPKSGMLTLLLIHRQGFPSRLNQLFENLQSDVLIGRILISDV
jgi:hypothetical protein